MKKLWLTYAWKDNEDKDVDFIIQELDKHKSEILVKFDRRNLIPGQRLWFQIGGIITDPVECDAWAIIVTKNSIKSEACIEELSYALDRAISSRGKSFPIIGLLHNISVREIPPVLRTRLCIPLEDDNWVSQVVSASKQIALGFSPSNLSEFILKEHSNERNNFLEIRPRFDRISPFLIAVELQEKESGNVKGRTYGPSGRIPPGSVFFMNSQSEGELSDGTPVYLWQANNEATSTNSYFLVYKKKPSKIWFGHPEKLDILPNHKWWGFPAKKCLAS